MISIPHDIAGAEDAMTAVATSVTAILPYVKAVEAISLGPQTLWLNGSSAGSWDPLSGSPATEAALAAAQSHCITFSDSTLFLLAAFPRFLASATGSAGTAGILNDLATVSSVVAAVAPGLTPTAAQRQSADTALSDIVSRVAGMQTFLSSMRSGASTFQDQMSADAQALDNGAASISTAQTQLRNTLLNACISYSDGPFGSATTTILESIAAQMHQALSSVQTGIDSSISDETAVVPALGRLADLFTGLSESYSTVAQQVRVVSDADFGSIMQQLDADELATFWQDASRFASENGFGLPA